MHVLANTHKVIKYVTLKSKTSFRNSEGGSKFWDKKKSESGGKGFQHLSLVCRIMVRFITVYLTAGWMEGWMERWKDGWWICYQISKFCVWLPAAQKGVARACAQSRVQMCVLGMKFLRQRAEWERKWRVGKLGCRGLKLRRGAGVGCRRCGVPEARERQEWQERVGGSAAHWTGKVIVVVWGGRQVHSRTDTFRHKLYQAS